METGSNSGLGSCHSPVRSGLESQPEPELDFYRSLLTLLVLTPLVQQKASVVSLDQLAIFLGISGTILAVLQYAPQIYMTYNAGLIGALSLSTMAIQVPGTVLFVISIAVTPGTNWTSWIPFAVSGAMQAALLVNHRLVGTKLRKVDSIGNLYCLAQAAKAIGSR